MTTQTAPVTIDLIGSMEHLAKWILLQFLYLVIAFALMLAAPVIFTVGMQLMAHYCASSASTWATIYLFVAPWFCAAWMAPCVRWQDAVDNWKATKMGYRVQVGVYERLARITVSLVGMFLGLVGSYIAEGIFTYAAHRLGMIPHHLNLYFALAPFAVFAPCIVVMLFHMLHKSEKDGEVVY